MKVGHFTPVAQWPSVFLVSALFFMVVVGQPSMALAKDVYFQPVLTTLVAGGIDTQQYMSPRYLFGCIDLTATSTGILTDVFLSPAPEGNSSYVYHISTQTGYGCADTITSYTFAGGGGSSHLDMSVPSAGQVFDLDITSTDQVIPLTDIHSIGIGWYMNGAYSPYPNMNGNGTLPYVHLMDSSPTVISNNIATTTTWYTGQVYEISGSVAINSGVALTVQPGAKVKFTTATSSLIVNGTLDAEGNYWATSTGPYNAKYNPNGTTTSAVSDYVDFSPWIGQLHYVTEETRSDCLPNYCSSVHNNKIVIYATSTYQTALDAATSTWNQLSPIQIIATSTGSDPDTLLIQEVSVSDVSFTANWSANDSNQDTLKLNSYYLSGQSNDLQQNTIEHELGHALGLDHSYLGNVMYPLQTTQTSLGTKDVDDYQYLWGN